MPDVIDFHPQMGNLSFVGVFLSIRVVIHNLFRKISMKSAQTGAISGCVVWIVVFGLLSVCLLPLSMMVGGFTSVTNIAMQTVAPLICPEGTSAQAHSYATTRTDEFGNSQPSTAYEMHCVDSNGTVVKRDPILYAFFWTGSFAVAALLASAALALALAAPAGILITRLFNRDRRSNTPASANLEPR